MHEQCLTIKQVKSTPIVKRDLRCAHIPAPLLEILKTLILFLPISVSYPMLVHQICRISSQLGKGKNNLGSKVSYLRLQLIPSN